MSLVDDLVSLQELLLQISDAWQNGNNPKLSSREQYDNIVHKILDELKSLYVNYPDLFANKSFYSTLDQLHMTHDDFNLFLDIKIDEGISYDDWEDYYIETVFKISTIIDRLQELSGSHEYLEMSEEDDKTPSDVLAYLARLKNQATAIRDDLDGLTIAWQNFDSVTPTVFDKRLKDCQNSIFSVMVELGLKTNVDFSASLESALNLSSSDVSSLLSMTITRKDMTLNEWQSLYSDMLDILSTVLEFVDSVIDESVNLIELSQQEFTETDALELFSELMNFSGRVTSFSFENSSIVLEGLNGQLSSSNCDDKSVERLVAVGLSLDEMLQEFFAIILYRLNPMLVAFDMADDCVTFDISCERRLRNIEDSSEDIVGEISTAIESTIEEFNELYAQVLDIVSELYVSDKRSDLPDFRNISAIDLLDARLPVEEALEQFGNHLEIVAEDQVYLSELLDEIKGIDYNRRCRKTINILYEQHYENIVEISEQLQEILEDGVNLELELKEPFEFEITIKRQYEIDAISDNWIDSINNLLLITQNQIEQLVEKQISFISKLVLDGLEGLL